MLLERRNMLLDAFRVVKLIEPLVDEIPREFLEQLLINLSCPLEISLHGELRRR